MLDLIVGIIGLVLILSAFVLEEFSKRLTRDTVKYNLLNIFGSGALIYYSVTIKGWPFLILNGVWFVTAAIKLAVIVKKLS